MNKQKTNKSGSKKPSAWFMPIRKSYLPVSWQGWLTYLPYITLLVLALYVAEVILLNLVINGWHYLDTSSSLLGIGCVLLVIILVWGMTKIAESKSK